MKTQLDQNAMFIFYLWLFHTESHVSPLSGNYKADLALQKPISQILFSLRCCGHLARLNDLTVPCHFVWRLFACFLLCNDKKICFCFWQNRVAPERAMLVSLLTRIPVNVVRIAHRVCAVLLCECVSYCLSYCMREFSLCHHLTDDLVFLSFFFCTHCCWVFFLVFFNH